MLVKLTYFKPSGKYYSDAEYFTGETDLWMIWNDVREMRLDGRLPGLVDGADEFVISVDVPEHSHNHPHLITLEQEDEHCEVYGCKNPAVYEGWWRVKAFADNIGLKRQVCEEHKTMLIGGK